MIALLWDHDTNTYETRDHYLMRPRPRIRPITVRPRPRPRPKKWLRDYAGLETLTSLISLLSFIWILSNVSVFLCTF